MMPSHPAFAIARVFPANVARLRRMMMVERYRIAAIDRLSHIATSEGDTGEQALADIVCLAGLAHATAAALHQCRQALVNADEVSIVGLACIDEAIAAANAALAPFDAVREAREAEAAAAAAAAEGQS